jgi:hypothetical protein
MDNGLLDCAKLHSEAVKIIANALKEISINRIDTETIAAAILARLAHGNILFERYKPGVKESVVEWIDVDKDLPDDEIAVLMVIEDCERPFFGWKLGDQWWHDCGDVVAGTVLYWADLPELPE